MAVKPDVDMLNAAKSVLADVSSVSPSSEQRGDYGLGESLYRIRVRVHLLLLVIKYVLGTYFEQCTCSSQI